MKNKIIIYQAKNGAIELRGDVQHETVWATQAQIADVFSVERSVITKHIRNILKDKELEEKSVSAKFAHTATDGKTYQVQYYNLDIILAVGYRTNSSRAIEFRQWATKTLRNYITNGFVVNKSKISKNYDEFMKTVSDIQNLLPGHINLDPKAVLDLIKEFASTWVSLDAYDKESLTLKGATKRKMNLDSSDLVSAILNLRDELISKKEATELFAVEREKGSVGGIVGNVMQTYSGKALYETVEEKSAHLLYFMIKNHPFVDGNKRSGALAFIWFLRKFRAKGFKNINPATLTALTLLIAESDPKRKDLMVSLVIQLLK
jgi:death-on-curing family protein